jgi:DNA-binding Lrp family transcriptional regulator
MNELEYKAFSLLVQNPRISYREMGSRLGISTTVVHKFMQLAYQSRAFNTVAVISTSYVKATMVTISGRMETERSIDEIVEDLRRNDNVLYYMICSSNMLYVAGLMRRTNDMGPFLKFVRETCHMKEPILAIESLGRLGDLVPFDPIAPEVKLSKLDLRIISSLHFDARKSYGDVAAEVGVTARTVRKHLERMIAEGSIELWVFSDPTLSPYITTAVQVHTRDGVDGNALGLELVRRFPKQIYTFRRYCNLPNLIVVSTLQDSTACLNDLLAELTSDERVQKVVPNVVISVCRLDTWREKLLPKLD